MPREIQWMQWGKEAFDRAKGEDKPILLDIMAKWCHWCHVMNRTTYSDPEVIDMVNERLVPVRVDCDERPDINTRYNRGGWPTTAFLTPEGVLMGGGTYLPPAQMKQTIMEYSTFYRENKQAIVEQSKESRWSIVAQTVAPEELEEAGLDNRIVERAIDDIRSDADLKYGGFGRAPKFPHPEAIDLALLWYHVHKDELVLSFANLTLKMMAIGGLYDHLGGGFHRYAVDQEWRVPHFEKLLDVNAQMLATYSRAYATTNIELYREVMEGTMGFLQNTLSGPDGAFYSSQNADVRSGDDGSHFTWMIDEVEKALPKDQARGVIAFYGMTAQGDIESPRSAGITVPSVMAGDTSTKTKTPTGRNVLHEVMTIDELAAKLGIASDEAVRLIDDAKRTLRKVRMQREAPSIDTKIITSWNALAAQAYFTVYQAVNAIEHLQRALQVTDFLTRNCLASDGGTFHCIEQDDAAKGGWRKTLHGQLCDLAPLANACLDAYEASGNRDYLARAMDLARFAQEHLHSAQGGYLDGPPAAGELGELAVKDRSIYDNSEMAKALARLYLFTGELHYQDEARRTLVSLLPEYERAGYLATSYVLAADVLLNYPVELVTVGPLDDPLTRSLHEASLRLFEPRRLVQLLDPERDRDLIERRGYAVTEKPTLFMCVSNVCTAPIHNPDEVREFHERFHTMAAAAA